MQRRMKSKNKDSTKLKPTPWSWKRFYKFWLLFTFVLCLMAKIGYDKYTGTFSPRSWGEILLFLPFSILFSAAMVVITGVAREKRKKDIYEDIKQLYSLEANDRKR